MKSLHRFTSLCEVGNVCETKAVNECDLIPPPALYQKQAILKIKF